MNGGFSPCKGSKTVSGLEASDRASEYVTELENQVIKMRTDNEIMGITLKHLQDELNLKSDLIRRKQ